MRWLLLPVVIAFVLSAVIMLTGTLLAARQISDRVQLIADSTSEIDDDLDAVRLAQRTSRLAGSIFEQARPLSGQLAKVVDEAHSIDRTAGSILRTAGSINGRVASIERTAAGIRSTAGAINDEVVSIDDRVTAIDDTVASIDDRVQSIDATVESIDAEVGSIDATVADIATNAGLILREATSIDSGVAGINRRVERVIAIVRPIEADTTNILAQVGIDHLMPDGDKTLHGHANSIDCHIVPAVDLSEYCGR